MDMAQWPQGIGVINVRSNNISANKNVMDHQADSSRAQPPTNMLERSASGPRAISTTSTTTSSTTTTTTTTRPVQKNQALNCPRCNSSNTKFCYYNNYSLSQPRYFCKTCRRYWTEGGSLRNVPVGGGSRKNKRSSSSSNGIVSPSSSAEAAATKAVNSTDHDHDHHHHLGPPSFLQQHPRDEGNHDRDHQQQGNDLNLSYPPAGDQYDLHQNQNPSSSSIIDQMMSNMNGISASSRGLISFMPMPTGASDSSGLIPVHEFMKPTFNFSSLDHQHQHQHHYHHGLESRYGPGHAHIHATHHVGQEHNIINNANARSLFPIDHENNDIKHAQTPSTADREQGNSTEAGYWNGSMFGGGSW